MHETAVHRWVGNHKDHDVALLKIEATGLKPVEFTDSKKVGVGNWVACAGVGIIAQVRLLSLLLPGGGRPLNRH